MNDIYMKSTEDWLGELKEKTARKLIAADATPNFYENLILKIEPNEACKTFLIDCGASEDSEQLVSAYFVSQIKNIEEVSSVASRCRYSQFPVMLFPKTNAATSFIRFLSQGVSQSLQYHGCALLKSVFDIGIEQTIISEIRPRSIIELGTGTGASALWYRDQLAGLYDDYRIITIDKREPKVKHQEIEYITGDLADIRKLLSVQEVRELPKPLLVVEDAHVHVEMLVNYFSEVIDSGDYIIIEDGDEKMNHVRSGIGNRQIMQDTKFTHLFGYPLSSIGPGVLVKTGEVKRQEF